MTSTSQHNTEYDQHITTHHSTSQHITSHHIISHQITAHHITAHHSTSPHFTAHHSTLHCVRLVHTLVAMVSSVGVGGGVGSWGWQGTMPVVGGGPASCTTRFWPWLRAAPWWRPRVFSLEPLWLVSLCLCFYFAVQCVSHLNIATARRRKMNHFDTDTSLHLNRSRH